MQPHLFVIDSWLLKIKITYSWELSETQCPKGCGWNANNPSYKWSFLYTISAPGLLLLIAAGSVQINAATTSCKSTWDTVPYFGINGLSKILCLWSPLEPLSKLLAIQDHAQNLEEQLWMGGRREVSIISHRPVTNSDLKQERSFFRASVSTFLQLVVAWKQEMILKLTIFINWSLEYIFVFKAIQPSSQNH